jgi:hypothetical protein
MKNALALSAAAVALLFTPVAADAGLTGDQVDVKVLFPDTATVFLDAGVTTVGPSVEYPVGSFTGYNDSASVDLTNDQIIFAGGFGQFFPSAFNGFEITVLSGPLITNAVPDAASTFDPVSLSIMGNELFVNFQGVNAGVGTSIIDVTTAASTIPEPSTWAMMALGFGALSLAGYRSRRRSVAIAA